MAAVALAFVAGVLSILSPCVLPILPILFAAAAADHRWGPVALACGLSLSFVAIGLVTATVGFAVGFDGGIFRKVAAVLMIAVATVLLLPRLQARVALAGAPITDWSERHFGSAQQGGLVRQAMLGMLVGAAWSPCVGPTLGAASILAAQGRDFGEVTATMLSFGLGAAAPLAMLGLLSREVLLRWRARLAAGTAAAKTVLAAVLISVGVLVLTGFDKAVETALVGASPQWLVDLTTRF